MFICTKKSDKFRNLTVGNVYEGIDNGETVTIVNDAGLRSTYSKQYFRDANPNDVPTRPTMRETQPERPAAVPPPPVVRRILDVIDIDVDEDDDGQYTITVEPMGAAPVGARSLRWTISTDGTSISCGISQAWNIHGLMPELRRFFETYQRPNYTGTIDELIDAIMRAFFEANDGGAFVIMSDSVSGLDNPLHNWLSAVASAQAQNLNPNSNNQIRIWVIACNI